MTVTATTAPSELLAPRTVSVARAYRFELVKQLAQWRVRILIGLVLDRAGGHRRRRERAEHASG